MATIKSPWPFGNSKLVVSAGSGTKNSATKKLVIVGMGVISHAMAPALIERRDIEVVAVVDKSLDALERSKGVFSNIRTYLDLSQCLDAVQADAVIINTPGRLHFQDALLTLERGLHCLVAKPLTPGIADARAVVEKARTERKTLCVAEQIRFNDHFSMVRNLLEEGVIGSLESVILMNSKPRPTVGSLQASNHIALEEMASHHFDILDSLIEAGGDIKVAADEFNPSWSRYAGGGMINVLLVYGGRVHVTYQGGVCAQAPMYELRLEGSLGALRCRGSHMSYGEVSYEVSQAEGSFHPLDVVGNPTGTDPWQSFLDSWTSYMDGGAEPPFAGRRNLAVLEIMEAVRESVLTGRLVTVPGDCD